MPRTTNPSMTKNSPRIANLIPFCREIQISMRNLIQQKISQGSEISPAENLSFIKDIHQKLVKKYKRIDSSLMKKGISATLLPLPSYRAYVWIRFLTDKQHLIDHLQALTEFHQLAQEQQITNSKISRYRGYQMHLTLFYIPYIYRTQVKGRQMELTIHESMVAAPIAIKKELILATLAGDSHSRRRVKKYCASPAYSCMEKLIRGDAHTPGASPKGKVIDLNPVFERVNLEYFHSRLEKPQLTWSQKRSYRKLGAYSPQTDTVTISRTFDSANIPNFTLDFIMYHELLHKKMGVKKANSGKHNHNKEFKELEKRFKYYSQANDLITQLTRRRL